MWTAVIGEHDRSVEEGHEQRIMVEKIYLHERFKEYHHDIGTRVEPLRHVDSTDKQLSITLFSLLKTSTHEAAETG